jgi:hypothetical protein
MAYFDTKGLFGTSPEELQRELFEKSQLRRQKEMEFLASGTLTPGATYLGLKSLEPLRTAFDRTGEDPRVQQLRNRERQAQEALQGFEFKTSKDYANAASRFMAMGMPDLATKFLKMAEARSKATATPFDDTTTKAIYSNVFNTTGLDLRKTNEELGITQKEREKYYNTGRDRHLEAKREGAGALFDKENVRDLSKYVKDYIQPRAAAAGKILPSLGYLERLNESADTGWGAKLGLYGSKIAQTFGLTDEEVDAKTANREAFESLAMEQVLNFVQDTKGSISNKEMDLFSSASVGLSRTKKGNALILKIARNMAELQQKVNKYYSAWRKDPKNKGKGYSDWQVAQDDFMLKEMDKMFTAEDVALMEEAKDIKVGAPQAAPQAAPQETPSAADVGTMNAPQPVTSYEEGVQVMPKGSYFITPEGDIYLVD